MSHRVFGTGTGSPMARERMEARTITLRDMTNEIELLIDTLLIFFVFDLIQFLRLIVNCAPDLIVLISNNKSTMEHMN